MFGTLFQRFDSFVRQFDPAQQHALAAEAVTIAPSGRTHTELFSHAQIAVNLRRRVTRMPYFNAGHSLIDHFAEVLVQRV
jgi:hypothetical protein